MSGIDLDLQETRLWRVVQSIIQLSQGRSNAVGSVTLRANETTTVVTKLVDRAAVNVGMGAKVFLTPETASAATAIGAGAVYVSAVGQGTFTLTHDSSAATDRRFGWGAFG